MFRKILVPLDGSELAAKVLDFLEPVLALGTASLLALRVRGSMEPSDGPEEDPCATRLKSLEPAAQIRRLEREGDPATEILAVAKEEDVSLVALSTHGRTGLARLVRGSVAERVLRNSDVPVLLASPFTEEATSCFQKILVPLDGSELSASALDLVAEIARVYGSQVVLFHVGRPNYRVSPQGERLEEVAANEFRSWVAPLVASLEKSGIDVKVEVVIEFGPAGQILTAVQRDGIDLVALTTHGRSGLARWAHGSVAEALIRECRAPLLVKRVKRPPG